MELQSLLLVFLHFSIRAGKAENPGAGKEEKLDSRRILASKTDDFRSFPFDYYLRL